jgi:RNA polymerase sigma-70 factor (sigma-E family)
MSGRSDDEDFTAFVDRCASRLLHTADLLTGDRARAEDLVQDALARSYLRWEHIGHGNREAYVRRAILHGYLDWWRRVRWRELPESAAGRGPVGTDPAADVDRRQVVQHALSALTRRERSVIVLRYWLDLPEVQIADELGIAVGTVKSTANRALTRLRERGDLTIFTAHPSQTSEPTLPRLGTPGGDR